ncbi:YerC/YecD family TrpR-related protein [Coralloluteibacterium stylophorae]|uniref:Trp operon repressor n=1 Tax=Coralloluteibacterium stylophorae TaxID=1776034 RepID=A0A8J7VS66_9GAMM|nr:YerC/YecD family TrpR-related protein [Coralloluteibacterium stylophorae]MBS7455891.1 trp operon repressor [Coralloluteibacterium stylophorae]
MKRRTADATDAPDLALDALSEALCRLRSVEEVRAFLVDLCTPAELQAISDRWRVVPLLLDGVTYREIHERTAVSTTTITRVARTLASGEGGYAVAARRLRHRPQAQRA